MKGIPASVMKQAQTRANKQAIVRASEKIIEYFILHPLGEYRAITKVTRHLLINAPYVLNGKTYDIVAKSVGAGVYKLTLKKL